MTDDNKPTFSSVVLLVNDIKKSRYFYNVVLGQKIMMDFGRNVGFEGGLAIWDQNFALDLIFKDKKRDITVGSNSIEIYFECKDIDALYKRLMNEGLVFIHPIQEPPWGQRAFRLYDPDNNIIEFAESMESVILRLDKQGLSHKEIAEKSEMPMDFIKMVLKK